MLKDGELPPGEKVAFLKAFDRTTMLGIKEAVSGADEIPTEINEKITEYEQSRSNKQFIQSDALRKELESLGYVVRDTADGSSITKRFFN
jgi:cysteinyl-tRNA synthetase